MPGGGTFRPFLEPDPPDFDRLPAGARSYFERRLLALPIKRIHTGIGAWAIMTNESRALTMYERDKGVPWSDYAPLGTWHMRAVHDRISAFRPDLLPARRPSGVYTSVRTVSRWERLVDRLVSLRVRNFLDGTYTWARNRAIDLRAATLRWRS